jgi:hypothetical protein
LEISLRRKRRLELRWRRSKKRLFKGFTRRMTLREEEVRLELIKREKQEEILWKQKSRINWLKEGDKNTKFFHNALLQRRIKNRIASLILSAEG